LTVSLSVYPFVRSPEGKMVDLWPDGVGSGRTLAGFEALRAEFYGSEPVVQLGCTMLAGLRDHDVFAAGDELDVLDREVAMILDKLGELVSQLTFARAARGRVVMEDGIALPSWPDYLAERLRNIAAAIATARQHPGGEVVIW
jgi:hypothetical protein